MTLSNCSKNRTPEASKIFLDYFRNKASGRAKFVKFKKKRPDTLFQMISNCFEKNTSEAKYQGTLRFFKFVKKEKVQGFP